MPHYELSTLVIKESCEVVSLDFFGKLLLLNFMIPLRL
jgi:hypothetical protein